jgi:hypothetical protein
VYVSRRNDTGMIQVLPEPLGFGFLYHASKQEMDELIGTSSRCIFAVCATATPCAESLELPTYTGHTVHFMDVVLALARRVIANELREKGGIFEELPPNHTVRVMRSSAERGAPVQCRIARFCSSD